MLLTFPEVASIARFAHKNGGTALTNIQAFALSSPGVLSKLLQEGLDSAGVLDSVTVKGFADDVETAFVALTAFPTAVNVLTSVELTALATAITAGHLVDLQTATKATTGLFSKLLLRSLTEANVAGAKAFTDVCDTEFNALTIS